GPGPARGPGFGRTDPAHVGAGTAPSRGTARIRCTLRGGREDRRERAGLESRFAQWSADDGTAPHGTGTPAGDPAVRGSAAPGGSDVGGRASDEAARDGGAGRP